MKGLKAPGPDGIPACFYQKMWPSVGQQVTDAVLETLNNGLLLKEILYTHIVLIPKFPNPDKVSQF